MCLLTLQRVECRCVQQNDSRSFAQDEVREILSHLAFEQQVAHELGEPVRKNYTSVSQTPINVTNPTQHTMTNGHWSQLNLDGTTRDLGLHTQGPRTAPNVGWGGSGSSSGGSVALLTSWLVDLTSICTHRTTILWRRTLTIFIASGRPTTDSIQAIRTTQTIPSPLLAHPFPAWISNKCKMIGHRQRLRGDRLYRSSVSECELKALALILAGVVCLPSNAGTVDFAQQAVSPWPPTSSQKRSPLPPLLTDQKSDVPTNYAWDEFAHWNNVNNMIWMCRRIKTGECVSPRFCNGRPKVDSQWPEKITPPNFRGEILDSGTKSSD
jgi:hypothetical protein